MLVQEPFFNWKILSGIWCLWVKVSSYNKHRFCFYHGNLHAYTRVTENVILLSRAWRRGMAVSGFVNHWLKSLRILVTHWLWSQKFIRLRVHGAHDGCQYLETIKPTMIPKMYQVGVHGAHAYYQNQMFFNNWLILPYFGKRKQVTKVKFLVKEQKCVCHVQTSMEYHR